ncbi:MAG: beta-lactamase family protein [Bacteroidales bacterium]|jgi:CubicO group peptidase (beta-lactamase class C family)|nr:beta-lactamase family protein [Bacteroidales bacterium]
MKKAIYTTFILLTLIAIYLLLPESYYIRKTLILGNANYDDYKHFHNREIPSAKHIPWKIDEKYNSVDIPEELMDTITGYDPNALIIIKDSTILYEKYWNSFNENTLSNSFSVSKSIVSLLIGAAIDEGKIQSLFQPVADFIPEYQNTVNKKLILRDLLTMSSGLNWEESHKGFFSMTAKAYYGNNLHKIISDLRIIEEPGSLFKYRNGDTQILAYIIESATGYNISEYTYRKYWQHMGAKNKALWCLDEKGGDEKAFCCFNSTARDIARWGQLINENGTCNGNQLISKKYIAQALSPARHLKDKSKKSVDFYGFQWWMISDYRGLNIKYMRGIMGQYVISIPQKNIVIVRLGNESSKNRYRDIHPEDIKHYIDAALLICSNAK